MSEIFTKIQATKIEPTYSCESICAFKDKVLIGTKQGYILVYSINFEKPEDKTGDVKSEFCFIIRDFNRKPITQIELVEEFGIFLSLSFGTIFVHRINDYKLISTTDIKNISKFCFDIYDPTECDNLHLKKKRPDSHIERNDSETNLTLSILSGEKLRSCSELRICIVTKRKLTILNWDRLSNCFKITDKVFRLPDYPIEVQFLCNSLCIATKYEYLLINIDTGETRSLFNVGKCQEPFILRVSDMLGLKIDDTVEFISKDGHAISNGNLRWSFVPSILLYHPPFAISLCDKYIEIRLISPTMLIQSLPVENASLLCRYLDRLYVLSDKRLLILASKSRNHQVETYSKSKDFQVALILAKTASLVGEAPIDSTKINIRYAISIFENRQFEKSFNIFTEMLTDPSHVLNLFPSLCPEKFKNITNIEKYFTSAMDFSDDEKKESIRALIDYLVKWRVKLRKSPEMLTCTSISDGSNCEKSKSFLQQIVDTTLLKCYLKINSPLVAPLLRQENFCHLEETKNTLEKFEKYQELVLLYENHGLHDKALNLLHSQSVKTHSPLHGFQPTLNYMKNLNYQNLDLIYQYGDWILQKSPMDWLTIFTHWYQKERLSINDKKELLYPAYKDNVLKHLQSKCSEMVIPFLERIIFDNINIEDFDLESSGVGNDQMDIGNKANKRNMPKFKLLPLDDEDGLPIIEDPPYADVKVMHTCYITSMINQISSLRPSILLNLNMNKELENSAPDSQYVYDLRRRLQLFLRSEKSQYNAEKVLSLLPYDSFFEERTLMLAKIGKHEQALTLWIYLLDDWPQAEEHCTNVYETNKEIFYKLLNICIEPSDPTSIGIVLPPFEFTSMIKQKKSISENKFVPRLDKALEVMKKYGDKLNPSLAMKLLSPAFEVKDLLPFAQNSLRRQAADLNQCVFVRNLLFYNRLASNYKVCISAKKCFYVIEDSKCSVCKKTMGSSAFARYPDESLVHYGCCKDFAKIKQ